MHLLGVLAEVLDAGAAVDGRGAGLDDHGERLALARAGVLHGRLPVRCGAEKAKLHVPPAPVLELLDSSDDAYTSALLVLHVLFGARSHTCGYLIFLLRCCCQPVVAGCECNIEPPHQAVLILDALGEVDIRSSWNTYAICKVFVTGLLS
jgi:hypothetical protein